MFMVNPVISALSRLKTIVDHEHHAEIEKNWGYQKKKSSKCCI